MKNFSELISSDVPAVPIVNWRTARGFDYASFCMHGHWPGGDYVDFVPMPNGEFALMLGETDAKGRRADWANACVRGAVRGFLARGEVSPTRLASELNRIIYELCSLDQIVSFLYAHYSAETSMLSYVNAGHESPLLLQNRQRNLTLLDLGGPVLGLKANSSYHEGSVRLRPGDRVIAFTTGLMDSLGNGVESSAEGELLALAHAHAASDSKELAGAILDRIGYAAASGPARDRSLVVVSRSEMPPGLNSLAEERELALVH